MLIAKDKAGAVDGGLANLGHDREYVPFLDSFVFKIIISLNVSNFARRLLYICIY